MPKISLTSAVTGRFCQILMWKTSLERAKKKSCMGGNTTFVVKFVMAYHELL